MCTYLFPSMDIWNMWNCWSILMRDVMWRMDNYYDCCRLLPSLFVLIYLFLFYFFSFLFCLGFFQCWKFSLISGLKLDKKVTKFEVRSFHFKHQSSQVFDVRFEASISSSTPSPPTILSVLLAHKTSFIQRCFGQKHSQTSI